MAKSLNTYAARFDLEPSLVNPMQESRFRTALDALAHSFTAIKTEISAPGQPAMQDDFWYAPDDYRSLYRPYVVKDGILQIPIKGVLLHDFGYQFFDMATGYKYIQKAVQRGLEDPEVRGIALVIDSCGGEVAGNFDLVDYIYAVRGQKPIRAFAHESAYSAAYSIYSCADSGQKYVSRTGGVGSIGVVTAHLDVSEAMAMDGYKLTWIFSGKHKVDGNMYEALKPEVKKRIQARVDELREIFASTMARNLGMDKGKILETEAATFTASEAVSNGLADKIGSLDDSLATFVADLEMNDGDENMTTANENTISAADHAKAIESAKAEGKSEGIKEGATAQRARISAILACEPAKVRQAAAMQVAMKSDMSLEAATEFLAGLPEEKIAAVAPVDPKKQGENETASAFEKRMAADGNVNLGQPDTEKQQQTGSDKDGDFDDRFERAMASVTGKKTKAAA